MRPFLYLVLNKSIFLVGLMGAGKTTVGQLLAKRFGFEFVDSDQEIEARAGASVATIFEIEGEASFRAREALIVDELTTRSHVVLATGGGAIIDPMSRRLLRERGTVIYLHTTPEMAYQRVRRSRERPMLRVEDPLLKLRLLYEQRHDLYDQCANHVVKSHGDRPALVVADIVALLLDE
jgi:shikimate kinase